MKKILGSFAACFALGAVAAEPTVSDVVVRQRWPHLYTGADAEPAPAAE